MQEQKEKFGFIQSKYTFDKSAMKPEGPFMYLENSIKSNIVGLKALARAEPRFILQQKCSSWWLMHLMN